MFHSNLHFFLALSFLETALVGPAEGLAHPDARRSDVHVGRAVPAGQGGEEGRLGPPDQARRRQGLGDLRVSGESEREETGLTPGCVC